MALLKKGVPLDHADATEHHARGEIALPGDAYDPLQTGALVAIEQGGPGCLACETLALGVRPEGEPDRYAPPVRPLGRVRLCPETRRSPDPYRP